MRGLLRMKPKNRIAKYSVFALLGLIAMTLVIVSFNPFTTTVAPHAQLSTPNTSSPQSLPGSSLLTSAPVASHHFESDDNGASSGTSSANLDN